MSNTAAATALWQTLIQQRFVQHNEKGDVKPIYVYHANYIFDEVYLRTLEEIWEHMCLKVLNLFSGKGTACRW